MRGWESGRPASAAIHRILRQSLYKGVYRVDRRWVNGKAIPLSEDEIEEYEVLTPPLISPADWEQAQKALAAKASTRPPTSDPETRPGIYGGFLECSQCGSRLQTVKDSNGYWGYRCGNYMRDRKGCSTGQTSIRKVDPVIDALLERTLGDIDTLTLMLSEAAQKHEEETETRPKETTRRITNLKNQRARVKDAYQAGSFSLHDLQKRIGAIDGELSALESAQNRALGPVEVDHELARRLGGSFHLLGRPTPPREARPPP